jgi:hypothetical protein
MASDPDCHSTAARSALRACGSYLLTPASCSALSGGESLRKVLQSAQRARCRVSRRWTVACTIITEGGPPSGAAVVGSKLSYSNGGVQTSDVGPIAVIGKCPLCRVPGRAFSTVSMDSNQGSKTRGFMGTQGPRVPLHGLDAQNATAGGPQLTKSGDPDTAKSGGNHGSKSGGFRLRH